MSEFEIGGHIPEIGRKIIALMQAEEFVGPIQNVISLNLSVHARGDVTIAVEEYERKPENVGAVRVVRTFEIFGKF